MFVMRRIIVAILAVAFSMSCFAQKLRPSDVPQEVRLGLENTYSDYKLKGCNGKLAVYNLRCSAARAAYFGCQLLSEQLSGLSHQEVGICGRLFGR